MIPDFETRQSVMNSPDVDTHPAGLATVGDWIRYAASCFAAAGLHFGHGTASAADEAAALVFHVLHLDFEAPGYFFNCRVTNEEATAVAALIERRVSERRPLPYLTREAWFCGLRFYVDERVLIPRSPIAELIEQRFEPWLASSAELRILDMCTGSGCIAVACALHFPEARVDAVDIDAAAIEVARINIERHEVGDRVRAIRSDLFAGLDADRYHLIVCNPPYVSARSMSTLPEEYRHEPQRALHADDEGLAFVHRLLREAPDYLDADGALIVEVGESAAAFDEAYPELPVAWCEFERGGEGVFALEASALTGLAAGKRHVG